MSINFTGINSYNSKSIPFAVQTGTIGYFDLTPYTEPVGDEKRPWVTNVQYNKTTISLPTGSYPVRTCTLTFTPSKDIGLGELKQSAILTTEVAEKTNSVNYTQIRIKASRLYLCADVLKTESGDFAGQWGYRDKNEKSKYGSVMYYSFSSMSSRVTDIGNLGIVPYIFSSESATYISFRLINMSADHYTSSIHLFCLDDIPIGSPEIERNNTTTGTDSTTGGYGGGSFDDSSDPFGLPNLPSIGVSEVGFVNVYQATAGQLVGFADELFPDFEMPNPSTKEGLDGVVENLNNVASVLGFFADSYLNKGLIDYVIDCHIVPVMPSVDANKGIKVGYKTFNYNPNKVLSDYVEFNCGSLQIAEYYQNFLDYEGTRAKLYLPFVGFVDIKPEWFQSGSLGVIYHFNIIDGSCIAFVVATSSKSKLKNTVVATFGANCCVHMPITGLNYSSMVSGILGGASTISSGLQAGSVGTIVKGLEQGALARPTLEQSNGYNAGMSFMCYRTPYLLIERPVASFSEKYPSEKGLPLNVTCNLSTLSGFTVCENPILDGLKILPEEKEMLLNLLTTGIIL